MSEFLIAMTATMATSFESLRIAKVGDRMGALVTGLRKADGGSPGSCGAGAPVVGYIDYVVPGRPADDDNASFQALTIGKHVVAIIAYDEQDLSAPVAVSSDIDGNGFATDGWSIPNATQLCAIVKGLHYQP
jgi:hypothetical protein